MDTILYFVLSIIIILISYILISFISLKKQQKKLFLVQESLQPNKNIVVSGGIYGKIVNVQNDFLNVEIAPNTIIKVSRYAVSRVLD